MLNKIFKSKGWTTAGFNISQNWIFVKLVIDGRCQFFCPHCGSALIRHTSREIRIRDLAISDRHVTICAHTFGGRCPQCQSFSTIRPPLGIFFRFADRWGLTSTSEMGVGGKRLALICQKGSEHHPARKSGT